MFSLAKEYPRLKGRNRTTHQLRRSPLPWGKRRFLSRSGTRSQWAQGRFCLTRKKEK